MARAKCDVVDVLRRELNFVEDGGYRHAPHAPWRAPSIFEDSPICPNFCDSARPHPCQNCVLIEFVAEAHRQEAAPCRFIVLTEDGRTLEDLYRTATQTEIEEALADWLRAKIAILETRGRGCEQGAA